MSTDQICETCWDCKGSGLKGGMTCSMCEGTGEMTSTLLLPEE